ncbi:DNA internalization-related competence protein ComEC/Rec2 [Vibrio rumoiensis]|uniref:DNA internalization-related competence protein ComEC/Rec2 n=1 Tax=Vibrio rumoiensis TaxID=76258 RepID=UPI00114D301E|nr:DNA internalization-related competence protein ComEC/Rec2 [Vibrio rumoiensis]
MARINRNLNMLGFVFSVASGVLWPSIPTSIWLLPIVVLFLVLYLTKSAQWVAGVLIGCAVVILHAHQFKEKTSALFVYGESITLQGKVTDLYQPSNQGGQFTFSVHQINGNNLPVGLKPNIQVFDSQFSGERLPPQLGEYWQLHVAMKPITGRLNDAGFDSEQYYVANGWSGKAVIDPDSADNKKIKPSNSWRLWLHQKVASQAYEYPSFSYILALGFGDRSEIKPLQWQQLRDSGLSHLMAISGLHIGLAMLIGWWIGLVGRMVCSRFSFINYDFYFLLPLLTSGLLALFYAYLAGFSIPTQRALIMGGAFLLMKATRLHWSGWQILLYSLCLILTLDPFSILQASFWLSFFAIVTIYLSLWFINRIQYSWKQKLQSILMVQIGVFIGLSVLGVLVFGGISLVSPFVNVLVIPWVSLITVPLLFISLFATALMGVFGTAEYSLITWQWVDWSLKPVLFVLESSLGAWMMLPKAGALLFLLLGLSVIFYHFRWIFPIAILWLVSLCLLVFPVTPNPKWQIEILDVGQGLAVLIHQNGKSVLYDTGINWPQGSIAQSVIIPSLMTKGIDRLDGLIISHSDADHAGGRVAIEQALSPTWKRSSERIKGDLPCVQGQTWAWESLQFEALWPPKLVDRAYNPHSCVIKISDTDFSFLLTGDIDAISEVLIARQYPNLSAQAMLVPHHGSRTSSLISFIETVKPELAIASVAKNNQWHLPSQDVVERYRKKGISWLETGDTGQITISIYDKEWSVDQKRSNQYQPWYRQIVRKGLE